jgi:DNA-binding winged helix-turn-helix (wHTH) protein
MTAVAVQFSRSEPFRVGDRTVMPQRNRILGPAGESHLEPRVMDVLCAMAANAGEVMSREMLIDEVWQVEFGGDESLTRAISILRKSLGAGCIETIAKRGYRLAASVDRPTTAPASLPPEPPKPARPQETYVLRRLGRGPDHAFPVASLDFWRASPVMFAVALAIALGIATAELLLAGR